MLLHIDSTTLYYTGGRAVNMSLPVDIREGITVLTGPNGSGKSTFAQIIEKGRNFRTNKILSPQGSYPVVRYMEFNDVHSWSGSVGYYQQRYEAGMNDEVPTVSEIMGQRVSSPLFKTLADKLGLHDAVGKKINYLSSGELRKLLIINALHDNPDLLILDNPYIGLDTSSHEALNEALQRLRDTGVSIMLLISDSKDAPSFADQFLYAHNLTISTNKPFVRHSLPRYEPFEFDTSTSLNDDTGEILRMENCNVHYGKSRILDNLTWVVNSGERWSLSGPNGSGKSTLLSLIYADNPKSYSNDIWLFGKRRGTGESIWDIKRNIGYVSPEMQLYFHGSGTVEHIVANGLNDTVGMFVRPKARQLERAVLWLKHFNIGHLADRQFNTLSAGERQLVLVARSMIKEPRLLILDEPMHALDPGIRDRVGMTIRSFLQAHQDSAFIMVTHNPAELPEDIDHHLTLPYHET